MRMVATQRERVIGKTVFNPKTNRREKGYSKEIEIVRSANCGTIGKSGALIHRSSDRFTGVCETGWMFFCPECGGYFVADPPTQ